METLPGPRSEFPVRIPLKVVGHAAGLDLRTVQRLIALHAGPQPAEDGTPELRRKGKYISCTFWVTLQAGGQEMALRQAILGVPGYVLQL